MGRRTDEDVPESRRKILEQADCDLVVLSIIAILVCPFPFPLLVVSCYGEGENIEMVYGEVQ